MLSTLISSNNASKSISTGFSFIDRLMYNGVPLGSIIEFYGAGDIGKTTIAIQLLNGIIRNKGIGVYLDIEHSLDGRYMNNIIEDLSLCLVGKPETAEETFDIISSFISQRTNKPIIIFLDSILALIPEEEVKRGFTKNTNYLHYEIVSKEIENISKLIHGSNVALVLLNNTKQKLSKRSKTTTTINRPIKCYADIRIKIEKEYTLRDGSFEIGNKLKFTSTKNNYSTPYLEVFYDYEYGSGLSKAGELLDISIEKGIVKRNGTWYTINNHNIQGRINAKNYVVTELC